MLSTTQLRELYARHNLTSTAQRLVDHIRASEPSRRTQSTAKSVSSRYPSRKMGCTIQAESHTNELAAIYLWDHDDETYEFYDQPPQIQISCLDKLGRSIPRNVTVDYFVLQRDFVGWVECKDDKWLDRHVADGGQLYRQDEKGKWHCPAGEAYAAQYGLGFRVRATSQTDWVVLRNLKFLSDYLNPDSEPDQSQVAQEIIATLKADPWLLLIDLIADRSGEETAVLYRLIAQGRIYVDMSRQLLCEPWLTRVFRSVDVGRAYLAANETAKDAPRARSRVLRLEVGQAVIWDGKPWRIINAGNAEITLQSPRHELVTIGREDIEALIAKGLVEGVADNLDAQSQNAKQVVASASSADLRDALFRYELLKGKPLEKASELCKKETPRQAPSERTLARWKRRFLDADKLFGNGYYGLITRRTGKGNRNSKLGASVQVLLKAAVDQWQSNQDDRSVASAWGELNSRCKELGLCSVSEKTFRRAIKQLDSHEVTKAQEGNRAAYASEEYLVMDRSTPRHGDRCFEIAHIDHTQVDLQLIGREFGENLRKPWLTILFDAYSRHVLAFTLSFDPPSYRSCMAVLCECVKIHSRMPDCIVSDSGAEFESIYYESLLARCNTTKKTRAKGKPRFGAVLERWFGVNNEQLIHSLRGNNRPLQAPRTMVPSHDPRTRAVWTLPEFRVLFEEYLAKVYHAVMHPALGVSPATAMSESVARTGIREVRYLLYTEDFKMMALPSTRKGTAKVITGRGVKIGYFYYNCPTFRLGRWQRADVEVRYDPMDMSIAYAYLGNMWVALRSEYASVFERHSEREIQIITQELRSRASAAHSRRSITAVLVAEYILRAKQSETVLLQRKKDQEYWAVAPSSMTAQASPPELAVAPIDVKSIKSRKPGTEVPQWKELELTLYGVFQ